MVGAMLGIQFKSHHEADAAAAAIAGFRAILL